MKKINKYFIIRNNKVFTDLKLHIIFLIFALFVADPVFGQIRDFRIHSRGTLHETIFNTGEIGRAYDGGTGGGMPGVPSFEWPGNSSVIVDNRQYVGQYNSMGSGLYLGASSSDVVARLVAFCGAAGVSSPEPVLDRYTFPLSIERIENFPILENGNVNPAYNPNEAEEIIISKWNTSTGITVTRTSRAWSLPD